MRKPKPREQRISIEQGQTLDSPQSSSPEVKQVSPEVENLNNDESEQPEEPENELHKAHLI